MLSRGRWWPDGNAHLIIILLPGPKSFHKLQKKVVISFGMAGNGYLTSTVLKALAEISQNLTDKKTPFLFLNWQLFVQFVSFVHHKLNSLLTSLPRYYGIHGQLLLVASCYPFILERGVENVKHRLNCSVLR
jgi:hypothetical protein